MSKSYKFSAFVAMASNISTSESTSKASKAILNIELQAVIQVIAQQLALHLGPSQVKKFKDILPVIEEVNALLDDENTGGGPNGGHGLVVALHLFKLLKSSRRFTDHYRRIYDSKIKDITCLRPFNEQLQVRLIRTQPLQILCAKCLMY